MILESVALFLFVTGLKAALTKRPKAPDPGDPKPPRAEEGAPVPVVFGTQMIAPNVGTFVPYKELAISARGQDIWTYFPHVQFILCHGPLDAVVDMRFDDGQTRFNRGVNYSLFPINPDPGEYSRTITVATDNCFGDNGGGGHVGGNLTFHFGESGQPVDSDMAGTTGVTYAPSHDGIAYAWNDGMEWGESAQMKAVRFIVRRIPWALYDAKVAAGGSALITSTSKIGADANPAAIVWEILTNTRWGLGLPEAVLDLDTFLAAAERLADDGLGLSFVIEDQADAASVIEDVCRHAYATLQQDPVTGLVRFDVHRDDDASEGDTLTTANATFVSVSRPSQHELPNLVWIEYQEPAGTDRDNTGTAAIPFPNEAAIQATGETRVEKYQYKMASRAYVASVIGARVLARETIPLARVRFTTDRNAAGNRIGTVRTINDPTRGLVNTRVRVTRIDWGTLEEGKIECEALEEPIPGASVVTIPDDGEDTGEPAECPVTLQESGVGTGLQWIPWPELGINEGYDGWLFDIQTFITSGAPNGINVGGTELGEDGWEVGGWTLFACGFANITVSRWLGGFEPGQYVTIAGTTSNWSSTAPVRAQTGYEWADPTTPGYHIVDTILDAGEWVGALNVIRFNGYADHEGRIKISVSWSWGGCDENFIHRMSFTEVLDYSAGCDPDEVEPEYERPTLEQIIPETSASTLTLTAIIGDETDAVEGGFAVVHFQTWDGAAWVDVGTYTKGTATGTASKVGDDPLTLQATVTLPADGTPVTWRVVIESYDSTDVLVEGDEEIGEGRAVVDVEGLQARGAFAITTASLANGATETGSVSVAKAFLLLGALTASRDCWLRLYGTAAARTADATRLRTEDPDAGAGILFEAIWDTSTGSTLTVGPIPPIANEDDPATATIYYAITNDGSTGTVAITGKALRLEAA